MWLLLWGYCCGFYYIYCNHYVVTIKLKVLCCNITLVLFCCYLYSILLYYFVADVMRLVLCFYYYVATIMWLLLMLIRVAVYKQVLPLQLVVIHNSLLTKRRLRRLSARPETPPPWRTPIGHLGVIYKPTSRQNIEKRRHKKQVISHTSRNKNHWKHLFPL
jgi:hypothetical protein